MTVLLITTVVIVARYYSPSDEATFVLCLFRKLTGLPCPGCGMTRSFCALAKGHWQQALQFHPLGPLAFFVFVAVWIRATIRIMSSLTESNPGWIHRLSLVVNSADRLAWRFRLAQIGLFFLLTVWAVRLVILLHGTKL